jgi:phosphoribosylamine--glycine ligase
MRRPRVLLVGGGGREHAIGEALRRSEATIYCAAPWVNPGLRRLASDYLVTPVERAAEIARWAKSRGVDLAVIGPEAAIEAGVTDALRESGILVAGPTRRAGEIETSKGFARELMERHQIPGRPEVRIVHAPSEVEGAIRELAVPFVVKPSGLAGGKGVWVQGLDFQTPEEGAAYARSLLEKGQPAVVLEERLEGEEFSLMAFTDGNGVYTMPAVRDYKRALEGHRGRNTGGMGSYSSRDHLLPFLPASDAQRAKAILEATVRALREEGREFRGILYGGFLLTRDGPKVLEFNARFGDPEALNVLTLFDGTDFADLLYQLAGDRITPAHVSFRRRATVVKYVVPPGYGENPRGGGILTVDEERIRDLAVTVYFGNVTAAEGPGRWVMGTSRSLGLTGEASAIHEAEARVEQALAFVRGDYRVRHDVASAADIQASVDHMRNLRRLPPFDPLKNPTRSGPAPPPIFV